MAILLINYYWPPCGGPAVQRWLDFAKRFSEDRIEFHVVTIDPKLATYTALDNSLVAEVPENCFVHTTSTSEWFDFYKKYIGKGKVPSNALADESNPTFLQKVARFVRGNVFLPDPRRGWNSHAIKKAHEVIRQHNIDIIITAGPPQSSHLIGDRLKKETNLPWIADFHDYWTDVFYLEKFYRTPIANYIDKQLEKSVLKNADAVLTHSEFGKSILQAKIQKKNKPFEIIRMGYDDHKFPQKPASAQERFTITYSGTLPNYYKPEVFFLALKSIINKNKEVPFQIKFVGIVSNELIEYIHSLKLESFLNVLGYLPHSSAVTELYNSTILLLVNPNVKKDQGIVPGKIYEYFACRKPIVSISSHKSENEFLLNDTQTGKNFTRAEQPEIEHYLQLLVDKWKDKKTLDFEDLNVVEYSRNAIYERLKSLINTFVQL